MSDLETKAIERLKTASEMSLNIYEQPLMLTYSGGKDSDVLLLLAERAGIPYEVCHSHTTADAPQTVYYVRDTFNRLEEKGIKCTVAHGMYRGERTSMWKLIVTKKIPPTRLTRYCCSVLKETAGDKRFIATGARWAESPKRKVTTGIYHEANFHKKPEERIILMNDNDDKREFMDFCYKRRSASCNPIIDWSDTDVWDYLSEAGISGNPLYHMGMSRVGCIGCPLASHKKQKYEFSLFPEYRKLYVQAFEHMLQARSELGLSGGTRDTVPWESGEDVMRWWLGYDHAQITFDDLEAEDEQEEI